MKRIGRLIFDIFGGVLAAVGLILCWFAFIGYINTDISTWTDYRLTTDGLNELSVVHWVSLVGGVIGAIAAIIFVVTCFMIFKASPHMNVTIALYVFAMISIILGITALAYQGLLSNLIDVVNGVIHYC